jgi:hypothetical protein
MGVEVGVIWLPEVKVQIWDTLKGEEGKETRPCPKLEGLNPGSSKFLYGANLRKYSWGGNEKVKL